MRMGVRVRMHVARERVEASVETGGKAGQVTPVVGAERDFMNE